MPAYCVGVLQDGQVAVRDVQMVEHLGLGGQRTVQRWEDNGGELFGLFGGFLATKQAPTRQATGWQQPHANEPSTHQSHLNMGRQKLFLSAMSMISCAPAASSPAPKLVLATYASSTGKRSRTSPKVGWSMRAKDRGICV